MEDSGIDSGDAKPAEIATLQLSSDSCSAVGDSPTVSPHPRSAKQNPHRLASRGRNQESRKASGTLLPLQRLDIPGSKETQPLVEWDTDDSSDDMTFYQVRPSAAAAHPRSKTRSRAQITADDLLVEELTPSDEFEDDADDLELVITIPDRCHAPKSYLGLFCTCVADLFCASTVFNKPGP